MSTSAAAPNLTSPRERRLAVLKGILLAHVLLGVWLLDSIPRGLIFHGVVLAGAAVGLMAGLILARRTARSPGRAANLPVFFLYGLLEHRVAVYVGLAFSALLAAAWVIALHFAMAVGSTAITLAGTTVVGIGSGLGIWSGRRLPGRWQRAALPLGTLGLVGLIAWGLTHADVFAPTSGPILAVNLLLLIPLLSVLLFIARAEDTALESATICAVLAVALWQAELQPMIQRLTLLVPAMVWFVLTTRIEKPLQWLKAILEAESFAQRGQQREALTAYRQAIHFRPKDTLARQGLWRMIRHIPEEDLVTDSAFADLAPDDELITRARALNHESPSDPAEAHRLLRVVARRSPVEHGSAWLELARYHAGRQEWDETVDALRHILDADGPRDPAASAEAWCVALATDELAARLGRPMLDAGRRMEAILAIERALPRAGDAEPLERVKQALYTELREDEYRREKEIARSAVEDHFDHRLCLRIGREWAEQPDRFDRAVEMLRIARDRANPCATTNEIAVLHEQRGEQDSAMARYEESKTLALRHGAPGRLPDPEEAAFVHAVTRLADWHEAAGRLDDAIDNHRLLNTPARRSLPAQLCLARLEQRRGHLVAAVNEVEQALMYDPKSAELLALKRRLYADVPVTDVRDHLDRIRPTFDFAWCLSEGRTIVDDKQVNREELEYARHLLWLAELGRKETEAIAVSLYLGRVHRRLGENDIARTHLEVAYTAGRDAKKKLPRPEDDAFHHACRALADMYLERKEYAAAKECLLRFRLHIDSGADTYFKLGQIEEALHNPAAARKHYQALVGIYGKHRLTARAKEAAQRLGTETPKR